jgi:L-ascorbate metabolism protein UlaG (beta-lactamase superfamily)
MTAAYFAADGLGGASNLRMSLLKRAEKKGRKFLNPVETNVGGLSTIRKVLPLYLKNRAEVEPKEPLGPFRTDARVYGTEAASGLRVTWFGHSSVLIEMDGMRVLSDPVWEQRASPVEWAGPKRFFAPTLKLEELPAIDVVLVSHDHYDHFGARTLKKLARLEATRGARWVTSLGVGKRLRKLGVAAEAIVELDWTESVQVGELSVAAWPARHFSGRGVLDRFTTLWGSFVLEGPRHRVYFGADSGWWEGFAELAARYERFDLVMLEIGAFHPLWASIHMGPEGAARAYMDMAGVMGGQERAGLLFPIHWGLFNLALHAWRQPVERIVELAAEGGLPLWLPEPGQPTEVQRGEPLRSGWWEKVPAMKEIRGSVASAGSDVGKVGITD